MPNLKQMLANTTVTTDGTDVRILTDGFGSREELYNALCNLQEDNNDQVVLVKAVIIFDDEGNYFIHGTSRDEAHEMFKAMSGIWSFDPSKEMSQQVEIDLRLPKVSSVTKPHAI